LQSNPSQGIRTAPTPSNPNTPVVSERSSYGQFDDGVEEQQFRDDSDEGLLDPSVFRDVSDLLNYGAICSSRKLSLFCARNFIFVVGGLFFIALPKTIGFFYLTTCADDNAHGKLHKTKWKFYISHPKFKTEL
jgi:hypothetical protein